VEAQPAPAPDSGDEVLSREHATVFIEHTLVEPLADKVLDAKTEEAAITFVLRERD
jgi:hypothetical protein